MNVKTVRSTGGFTLVEIAIALLVVGILTAFIMQLLSVLEMSRAKATVALINNVKSGTQIFFDTYNALPGDMPNPQTSLPGCTTAPCNIPGDNALDADNSVNLNNPPAGDSRATEGGRFFVHLAAAGLLNGINPRLPDTQWGSLMPELPFAGNGMTAGSYRSTHTVVGAFGTQLIDGTGLQRGLYLNIHGGTPAAGAQSIEASIMRYIDASIDDGLPSTGIARAKSDAGPGACVTTAVPAEYKTDDGQCGMFFFIGQFIRN